MDYNFWDDRTHEIDINPCDGCLDYKDGNCTSNGACGLKNKRYVLIKTNDMFNADNIEGRLQTEIYSTYEEAYECMKNEVVRCLSIHDKRYEEYLQNVLEHWEYTNVCLGKWSAREHSDYGKHTRLWKIVEVTM